VCVCVCVCVVMKYNYLMRAACIKWISIKSVWFYIAWQVFTG